MNESIFDKLDFGPLKPLLDNDDITDISYCNGGQIWIRSLTQGSIRVEVPGCTQEFMEKLAFQCSNVMGTTFNNAKPFLDAESSELRLNFVHQSIATNGIACVLRKTPAKIRLQKEKLLKDDYFTNDIHDVLIKCVEGHCNIIVCGETGSGKTEFVKYLASHTKENEKIITIEDTLELHLDKIFPHRDIVAMKTNNVASYSDVLVTCMRQNPKWILLSEVRSAEAVSAVRNSISSGHNILSTIHADKASAIPYRLYSLMETDLDVDQFLATIYRYIQLGVHIKAYYSKKYGKFHREVDEVTEFYVDENNVCQTHTIYRKLFDKEPIMVKPSRHLIEYLSNQNIDISNITSSLSDKPFEELIDEASSDSDDTTIPKTEASVPSFETTVTNNNSVGYNVIPSNDFEAKKEENNSQDINNNINQSVVPQSVVPLVTVNNVQQTNTDNSNEIKGVIPNVLFSQNPLKVIDEEVSEESSNKVNNSSGLADNIMNVQSNNLFSDGNTSVDDKEKEEEQVPGFINTVDINDVLNGQV
ncbi:MAG: CpaF family protein [Bacilli bacterium]|nr:CpaF family protein [Bacilli bacterium]